MMTRGGEVKEQLTIMFDIHTLDKQATPITNADKQYKNPRSVSHPKQPMLF
jgi:hypothetical protein